MPFIQRFVDPTHVSQVEVDRSVTNELECVTNHSLANIIRQLSSLSKHAEDMFSELYRETSTFFNRASQLNSRVEHLRITVTQLNPTEEVVSLQDIHLRKPYRSSNLHDQQVVSRVTMTQAIQDMYLKCEKPPALDKLNTYREDGKDCMKFYTDPSYFFELWYSEIKKDIDNKKNILRKKRDKKQRSPGGKQVKPKTITSKVDKFKDQAMGKEFESGYNEPVISRTDKPIPPGYTRQNSGQRPENLDVQNGGQYGQTHVPDHTSNHVDKQAMNGPYVISETQDPNYSSNQRQSQSMRRPSAQQNQNQSPRDRRTAQSQRVSNIASPNRPVVPPPPPPPDQLGSLQRNDRASMSPQRESLPPPPLPPPLTNNYSQSPQMMRNAQFQNVNQNTPGVSPVRQMSPQRDQDLPPPPPPPPLETPDSPNVPPPPPPMLQNSMVPPPPPPPPPPPAPVAPPIFMNGQMGDTVSVSSNNSTTTYSSTASAKEVEPPPQPVAETGRNALLEEIRLGDWNKKLKRTDERKQDAAPPDRFDVHAVMTRAFDMRRRVIEDSESEDEDSEDEWDVAEW